MASQLRPLPHRHLNGFSSIDSSVPIEPKRGGKNCENKGCVDRLSELPDHVLCHILSFLDTKYAVAASVLSTRWKHLNTYVPNIILDDSLTEIQKDGYLERRDFGFFALKQFRRKNVPYIDKFHLICDTCYQPNILLPVVIAAIVCNVREVNIYMGKRGNFHILPPEFFTRSSLVDLKLSGVRTQLVVPSRVELPNLKVLHLDGHYINSVEEGSINRLLRGCKSLEDLCISCCEVRILELSFPFLRNLSFGEDVFLECEEPNMVEFVMDTPNLEVFEYRGHHVAKSLCMRTLPPHARAKIELVCPGDHFYDDYRYNDAREFIDSLRGFKSLHLSSQALKSLYPGGYLPSQLEASVFETLTELEFGCYNFKELPSILERAPLLKVLILRGGRGTAESFPLSSPEMVPKCLAKHLRIVEFKEFVETDEAFELVKYILRNGYVMGMLKFPKERYWSRVKVISDDSRQRVLSFPRCSKTCKIVFD